MRILLIGLLLIMNTAFAFSQKRDSLKQVLKQELNDEKRINTLVEIAMDYWDLDSSDYYVRQALELSENTNNNRGLSLSYAALGANNRLRGKHQKALKQYIKAEEYAKTAQDTNQLSIVYLRMGLVNKTLGNYEKAIELYKKSAKMAEIADNISYQADAYNNMGNVYRDIANYRLALENQFKALKLREQDKNGYGIAMSYNNIGNIYFYQEDYEKAIEYYDLSLHIKDSLNLTKSKTYTLGNKGACYKALKKNESAKAVLKENLNLCRKVKRRSGILFSSRELADIYISENQLDSALKYIREAEKAAEIIDSKERTASVQTILAKYYNSRKDYKKAIKIADAALKTGLKIKNYEQIRAAAFEKSFAGEKMGKTAEALEAYKQYVAAKDSIRNESNLKKALSQEFAYKEDKMKLEQEKKDIAHKAEMERQRLVRNAFIAGFGLMIALAFVILNSYRQKRKANIKLNARNTEISQQKEEIQSQAEELEKINSELEKLSIVASETDNAIVIMDKQGNFEWINAGFTKLYGYTFKEFTGKHKNLLSVSSNEKINDTIESCIKERKPKIYESVTQAKDGSAIWVQTTLTPILDHAGNIKKLIAIDSDIRKLKAIEMELKVKNQHITDSIRYAKTIQTAILPFKERISKHFENFILFRPKDIVSGDFYWYVKTENYHFIAAVDCTGHGVPGAFMSMIGSSILNQIVYNDKEYNTGKILEKLNELIIFSLRQEQTDNNDGMDVCLCRIEKTDDSGKIQFTGAKRPLMYVNSGEAKVNRIRGDRKSIGGTQRKRNEAKFTTENLLVPKGSVLYLSSDGYADQNNTQRKKIGSKKIIELIQENASKSLAEQNTVLQKNLDEFMQGTQQRDDITLLGIKI